MQTWPTYAKPSAPYIGADGQRRDPQVRLPPPGAGGGPAAPRRAGAGRRTRPRRGEGGLRRARRPPRRRPRTALRRHDLARAVQDRRVEGRHPPVPARALGISVHCEPEHAQAHAELRPHAARTPRRRRHRRARRRPALAAAAGALQRQRTLDGHGPRRRARCSAFGDGATNACPLPTRGLCSVLNGTVAGSRPQLGAAAAREPRRCDHAAAAGPNAQSDRAAAANGVGAVSGRQQRRHPSGAAHLGADVWWRTWRKRTARCRRCHRSRSSQDGRRKR